MKTNKFGLCLTALLLVFAVPALAVNSVIVPEVTTIEPNDVKVVKYCVSNSGNPLPGIAISVEDVCKDQNGIIGCQAADDHGTTQLAVVALDALTGADGCGDVQLTSTGASGTFYYSVTGSAGGATITGETGTALVPEFSTIMGAVTLGIAGLLVWRKQQ